MLMKPTFRNITDGHINDGNKKAKMTTLLPLITIRLKCLKSPEMNTAVAVIIYKGTICTMYIQVNKKAYV